MRLSKLHSTSLVVLIWMVMAGCGSSKTDKKTKKSDTKPQKQLQADEVMQKMLAAYASCKSYSDKGVVRLLDGEAGKPTSAPLAVDFKRPKFLRVRAYQLEVASDGQFVRAKIHDQDTNDFDHQVVLRPLGEKIELADLYTDRELYEAMTRGLAGHPLQLELLLGKDPLQVFRESGASRKLIAGKKFEGHRCYRLLVQNRSGRFVLWIDEELFLLRKVEYPSIQTQGSGQRLKLVAELHEAKFQVDEPATYSLPKNDKDRQVRFFVRPPQPLPSKLFGKRPATFKFTDLKDKPVAQAAFDGKTTVLAWFNDHPLCQQTMQQLEDVRKQFAKQQDVRFLAVAILASTKSNSAVQQLLTSWKTDFEIVRDLKAVGKNVFSVNVAPSIVVLGPNGRVQVFQEGMNPNLRSELPQVISKVAAKQNVAGLILREYDAEQKKYQQSLGIAEKLAGKKGGQASAPRAKTPAAKKRLPARLQLKTIWTSKVAKSPGNLLLLPDKKQVVAVDDANQVVVLDEQGKEVAKAILAPKSRSSRYSLLRSWRSKKGKRIFAASSIRGQSVSVYDQDWKLLYSYPPKEQPHEGIGDVQIADLDGDDKPELYVGFWGVVGIHQVIDGKRKRGNRLPSNVVSMTTSPPNPIGWYKLMVTTNSGRMWRLNQYLREDPSIDIPGWAVFRMSGNQQEASAAPYIGLAYDTKDQLNAVAITKRMKEAWHYPLPNGVFPNQIQLAHSGTIAKRNVWLLVAPDSSIHIISPDGEFSDNFAMGEHLSGLALGSVDNKPVLYMSISGEIRAYEVSEK